jgi:hypothetical protein
MKYQLKMLDHHLKFAFNKSQKHLFENFRSKDVQEIILHIIETVLNLDELKRKQILVKSFFMHDMGAISDIREKYKQTSVWNMIKMTFTDYKYQEYHAFTAVKNYLGERWGFQYAFYTYYTTYLSIPSVFGLICTWYQYQTGQWITLWSFAYAMLMSLWITIF